MRDALARHDEILRDAVAAHDGHVVKTTGDGVHAVFATASDAVDAAVDAQRRAGARGVGRDGAAAGADGPAHRRSRAARRRLLRHRGEPRGPADGGRARRSDRVLAGDRRPRARRPRPRCELIDLGRAPAARPRHAGACLPGDARRASRATSLRCARSTRSRGNLPLQLTAFVGRDDELAAVSTRCSRATRARHAHRHRRRRQDPPRAPGRRPRCSRDYPDGAWFVDLAPVGDPDFVAAEYRHDDGLTRAAGRRYAKKHSSAFCARNVLLSCSTTASTCVDMAAHVADLVVRRAARSHGAGDEPGGARGRRRSDLRAEAARRRPKRVACSSTAPRPSATNSSAPPTTPRRSTSSARVSTGSHSRSSLRRQESRR